MATAVEEDDWSMLLTMLPSDLETSARETGALRRRRGVPSAAVLLRLAMVYAHTEFSLRSTALWAREQGLADLSDVSLLNRLRNAAPWIGRLLTEKLAERTRLPTLEAGGVQRAARLRVRLMDANTVSEPG